MISSADGEVLLQLSEKHQPTAAYVKELRRRFCARLSDDRVLLPRARHHDAGAQLRTERRPFDVQIAGPLANNAKDYAIARKLREQISHVRGAVDVHLAQVVDQPEVRINVDREEAIQQGLTQRDVASDALVSMSSSGQVAPNFLARYVKRCPVPRCGADAPIQGRLLRRGPADARCTCRR